ncbi:MAG: ThuA domain-containing protein, partial [Proteobacteria bacterium]|nr:ThuA domain-containing protein [Pseudomonadota bacterium]
IEDEPYYCEFYGEHKVLLEANYRSPSSGYVRSDFGTERDSQPQMYLHQVGEGEVLYLTLGHCSGKYDMQPILDVAPVNRCAWNYPVFYDLLRRGIRWGIDI